MSLLVDHLQKEYRDLIKNSYSDKGPGLASFHFDENSNPNCEYHYSKVGSFEWQKFIEIYSHFSFPEDAIILYVSIEMNSSCESPPNCFKIIKPFQLTKNTSRDNIAFV